MDLTFKALGQYGRLGNQLFQVASTIGIATKGGHNFVFPDTWEEADPSVLGRSLLTTPWQYERYFKTPLPQQTLEIDAVYDEGLKTDYREIILPQAQNCNLHGYFQSYKYFEHCADLVRYYLTPRDCFLQYLLYRFPLLLTEAFTAVHLRRGDYKGYPDIYCQLDEPPLVSYYHEAVANVGGPQANLLVFSDDIHYVKHVLPNPTGRIIYVNLKNDILSLFLMSLCHNQIIANSSFSWWAAWLNNNPGKQVFAPKNWFTPQHMEKSYDDPTTVMENLIHPSWNLI
jgi:hypothetical protein